MCEFYVPAIYTVRWCFSVTVGGMNWWRCSSRHCLLPLNSLCCLCSTQVGTVTQPQFTPKKSSETNFLVSIVGFLPRFLGRFLTGILAQPLISHGLFCTLTSLFTISALLNLQRKYAMSYYRAYLATCDRVMFLWSTTNRGLWSMPPQTRIIPARILFTFSASAAFFSFSFWSLFSMSASTPRLIESIRSNAAPLSTNFLRFLFRSADFRAGSLVAVSWNTSRINRWTQIDNETPYPDLLCLVPNHHQDASWEIRNVRIDVTAIIQYTLGARILRLCFGLSGSSIKLVIGNLNHK